MVGRVAIRATHVAVAVHGARKVHLLFAGGMAGHAALVDLFRGMVLKDENLRLIPAAGHVFRPGTMATFTSLMRRASPCIEGSLPMWGLLPGVIYVFVTGLTGVGTDVIRLARGL